MAEKQGFQEGGYQEAPPPYAAGPYQQGAPGQPPYPPQGSQPHPQGSQPYPQGTQPYPQGTPVAAPTVLIAAPLRFGEAPIPLRCQFCQADIITATQYESGLLTWLLAGMCCVFGMWLGCCLIPFCIDACKDVEHICPNCRRMVGKYKRA